MPFYGSIVVIKRSGEDGNVFPLMAPKCVFGRALECDIRIYIPAVSMKHCYLEVNGSQVYVVSFEGANTTLLNGSSITERTPVHHRDVITICERSFRFEYPPDSMHCSGAKQSPVMKQTQESSTPSHQDSKRTTSTPASKLLKSPVSVSKPQNKSAKKVKASPSESKALLARKNVSFGPNLSPEQFSKVLPPSTPVYKGGVPKRRASVPDYFGSPIVTPLRSIKSKCLLTPTVKTIQEESPKSGVSPKLSERKQVTSSFSGDNLSPAARQKTPEKSPGLKSPKGQKNKGQPLEPATNGGSPSIAKSPRKGTPKPTLTQKSPRKGTPVQNTPKTKLSQQNLMGTPVQTSPQTKLTARSPATTPAQKSPKSTKSKALTPGQKISTVKTGRLSLSVNKKHVVPQSAKRKSLPAVAVTSKGTSKSPGSMRKRLSVKVVAKARTPKRMAKKSIGKRSASIVSRQSLQSDHTLVTDSKNQINNSMAKSNISPFLQKPMLGSPSSSPSKQIAIVQPLMGADFVDSSAYSPGADSFKLNLSSSSSSPDITEKKSAGRKSTASPSKLDKSVPKIQSPSSPDVKKSKALRNIHGSQLRTQSLKKTVSQKKSGLLVKKSAGKLTSVVQGKARRPLFSEVLKFYPKKKTPVHKRSVPLSVRIVKPFLKTKTKLPPASARKSKVQVSTTGHANSPETILIKKTKKLASVAKTRKGRKTPHKNEVAKLKSVTGKRKSSSATDLNLTGISEMMKGSPRNSRSTDSQIQHADNTLNYSAVNASNISTSIFVSPLMTPMSTGKAKGFGKLAKSTPTSLRKRSAVPELTDVQKTPRSPRKSIPGNLGDVQNVFASLKATPKADYRNVSGVKKLVKSPRKSVPANYTNVSGIKKLFRSPDDHKSPVSDYTNVSGVKKMFDRAKSSPRGNYSLTHIEIGRLFDSPQLSDIVDDSRFTTPKSNVLKSPVITNSAGPSSRVVSSPVNKRSATKRSSTGTRQSTPKSKLKRSVSPTKSVAAKKHISVDIIPNDVVQTLGDVLSQIGSPTSAKKNRGVPATRLSKSPAKRRSIGKSPTMAKQKAKITVMLEARSPKVATPSSATRTKRGVSATKPSPTKLLAISPRTTSPKTKRLSLTRGATDNDLILNDTSDISMQAVKTASTGVATPKSSAKKTGRKTPIKGTKSPSQSASKSFDTTTKRKGRTSQLSLSDSFRGVSDNLEERSSDPATPGLSPKKRERKAAAKSPSLSVKKTMEAILLGVATPISSPKKRARKQAVKLPSSVRARTGTPTVETGVSTPMSSPKTRVRKTPAKSPSSARLSTGTSKTVKAEVATPISLPKKRGTRALAKSPSDIKESTVTPKAVEALLSGVATPISSTKKRGRKAQGANSTASPAASPKTSVPKKQAKAPLTRKGRKKNVLSPPKTQMIEEKSDVGNKLPSPIAPDEKVVKPKRGRRGQQSQATTTPDKVTKRAQAVEATAEPEVIPKRTAMRSKKAAAASPKSRPSPSRKHDTGDSEVSSGSPANKKVAGRSRGKGKAAAGTEKNLKKDISPVSKPASQTRKRKGDIKAQDVDVVVETAEVASTSEASKKKARGRTVTSKVSAAVAVVESPSPARKRKGTQATGSPNKVARKEPEVVAKTKIASPPARRTRGGRLPQTEEQKLTSPKLSVPEKEAATEVAKIASPAQKKPQKRGGRKGAEQISAATSPKTEAPKTRRTARGKASPSKTPTKGTPQPKASPTVKEASLKRGTRKQKVNFLSPVSKVLNASISSPQLDSPPKAKRGKKVTQSDSPVKTTRTTRKRGAVKK